MEWLEFDAWAAEVGRKLAAKLEALHLAERKAVAVNAMAKRREQLAALLRTAEQKNPWGHVERPHDDGPKSRR